jgi:hypothetical protein
VVRGPFEDAFLGFMGSFGGPFGGGPLGASFRGLLWGPSLGPSFGALVWGPPFNECLPNISVIIDFLLDFRGCACAFMKFVSFMESLRGGRILCLHELGPHVLIMCSM